jgi:DHA1 family bicyclomycin/chloramphenicol resistance-like MFS transporter
VQSGLAPLGPVYAEELHLSRLQVGALFAAASVAMVVVAFPIGLVTDRLGARRLTVGAAALVALSALGQGLGQEFWLLLASRAAFGVAFGAVWTAGLALLSEGGAVERRSVRLGASIPVAGAASTIGPAFAGVVAGQFGVAAPFVVIAAAAAATAAALVLAPAVVPPEPVERASLRRVLGSLGRSRHVAASVAILVVAGFSGSLAYLLVPLRLKANGLSVGAIGAILAASALCYIGASMAVTRLGERAATPVVAGVAVTALGLALALPALTTASIALSLFLLLRSACNAAMSTVAYPLASAGAAEAGIGTGTAIGLVNAAWAMSTAVAPLAGGAIAQSAGDRAAFAVLVPVTLLTGVWLFTVGARRSARVLRRAARSHR